MSNLTTVTLGGRQVLVKREDLLHPFVSGNKFRKLKYNLLQALELGASEIISFGVQCLLWGSAFSPVQQPALYPQRQCQQS